MIYKNFFGNVRDAHLSGFMSLFMCVYKMRMCILRILTGDY